MRINRKTELIKVLPVKDRSELGIFEFGYDIEGPPDDVMQEIVDWLSRNCFENFIVTRSECYIIAGGYSNNLAASKKGLFDSANWGKDQDRTIWTDYRIKLSTHDNTMFSMVWLDHSN